MENGRATVQRYEILDNFNYCLLSRVRRQRAGCDARIAYTRARARGEHTKREESSVCASFSINRQDKRLIQTTAPPGNDYYRLPPFYGNPRRTPQTARTFLFLDCFNRHFVHETTISPLPRYSQCFRYSRRGASNCVAINNNNVSLSFVLRPFFPPFSSRVFDSIYSLRYPVVTYTH